MVAKAMTIAEQQHGFVFELLGRNGFLFAQWMLQGQRGHEGLVVQRRSGHASIGKGFGQDGAINFSGAQHLHQFDGEVFVQHERHLRCFAHRLFHQVGQQIRADGVDHPQTQGARQRVFAALRNLFDFSGLF